MSVIETVSTVLTIVAVCCFLFLSTLATLVDIFPLNIGIIKKFRQFRARSTIDVLRELKIDISGIKTENQYVNIPSEFRGESIISAAKAIIESNTHNLAIRVGENEHFSSKTFINIMGASVNSANAKLIAKLLSSFISENKSSIGLFDFLCTPKSGSPIIGYELSNILNVPYVIHKSNDRIKFEPTNNVDDEFDGEMPEPGKIALLIDDSSTGGTMFIDAAKALKKRNYQVKIAVVLFKPTGKRGAENLQKEGVILMGPIET